MSANLERDRLHAGRSDGRRPVGKRRKHVGQTKYWGNAVAALGREGINILQVCFILFLRQGKCQLNGVKALWCLLLNIKAILRHVLIFAQLS